MEIVRPLCYGNTMMKTIYDMSVSDLSPLMVGNKIVAIVGNEITLSNGTVLEIEDTADCCAWFDGKVEAINLDDNMVTACEWVELPEVEDCLERYTINILSADKVLAKIDIEGDSSSGYYCSSVNLIVKVKGE